MHMNLIYYGHACFGVETRGRKLLFDPFINGNPLARHIQPASLEADYLLITHGHGDHVGDGVDIAKRTHATVVSNYEIVSWFEKHGAKGHPMNHGGKKEFDFGTLKYVNAVHTSALPDGSNGGNPGGFVVWNDEVCFYHAGDTALTWDMKLIPLTAPKLDFAILPIGDNFTMGYDDAALAAEFIECDHIVACHYDTFGYIQIDHDAAQKAFKARGKNLIFLGIGERWSPTR
jgi:L-ascorbate metabolism protein UlaG (beta-lactamase superfamily)